MTTDPSDFIPPELQEIAELLPAYEILSFIAKGGMGAVYMARQKSLDRPVAIKILPRHFGQDESFRASFEAEAKSMAKLNHPNLISIYDFGQVDGLLYIIMEMVQGKSLYHSSYGKTIDPATATRIVTSICHGLANAHKHGILHRDIKPANILLDPSASPKIGDFGLARPVGDHESDSAFGTPGYTAPEVIHNPSAVDESTDIYAVGAILYELLTSKLPAEHYIPAANLVNCNPEFDQIIRKAMHPSPAERYRSADDMAEDLEQILNKKAPSNRQFLQPTSKPSSATARTLLTAAPSTNKPVLQTAANSAGTDVTPLPVTKVGSNVPFVRNILIIVALLATIYIALEGLKVVKASRAKEQERITALKEQQDKDAAKKKADAQAEKERLLKQQQVKPTPPPKKIVADTPRETLNRLQDQLFEGKRTEMPKGTIINGGRARFFIHQQMTWNKAQKFCAKYGGHLAVLPDLAELQALSAKLKSNQTIWLGGGSAGNDQWQWIDGTPWNQKIRNTSKAAYIATDDTGILDPQHSTAEHSFFIEWKMDGSNPTSLEQQLKRSAATLGSENPVYPAGTTSYDNRHYLVVHELADWNAARSHAKLAGGELAVPSNPDENQWILGFLASSLKKDEACWIGGTRKTQNNWAWVSGEPWSFAKWAEGAPDEEADTAAGCAVTPTKTWDDFPTDASLACFLIEWGSDGEGHTEIKEVVKKEDGNALDIEQLHAKCALLIIAIQKRYKKQLADNAKGYNTELSSYKRSLPKSQREAYEIGILQLQRLTQEGLIQEDLTIENMPAKLGKILNDRLKRQQKIQGQFKGEIEDLREKYRRNLLNIREKLTAKGLKTRLVKVEDELEATQSDTDEFISYILNG